MSTKTLNLRSLARLCADFNVTYQRIERIVESRHIPPAMVLDGRRHYDEAGAEQILDAIRTERPARRQPMATA